MILEIEKLDERAVIPKYETAGAAGFDITIIKGRTIGPKEITMLRTGLAIKVPEGYELQIRQRSGISCEYPNYICNAPGTIDSDYTGEIRIITVNNTEYSWAIKDNIRFAQGIIQKVERVNFKLVDKLKETERGPGGFGHTGL